MTHSGDADCSLSNFPLKAETQEQTYHILYLC